MSAVVALKSKDTFSVDTFFFFFFQSVRTFSQDENDVDPEGTYKRKKRYAFDIEKRRWTYGIIPFTFDKSLGTCFLE